MTSDTPTPHVSHVTAHCVLQPCPGVSPLCCPPSLTGQSPGSGGSGAASTGSHAPEAALWWGMTWPTVTEGSGVSPIRPCASVSEGIVIISPLLITFLETGSGEPVVTSPDHPPAPAVSAPARAAASESRGSGGRWRQPQGLSPVFY